MRVLVDIGIIQIPVSSITVLAEIERYNIYRSDEELEKLRMQIMSEGEIRDPLVIWKRGSENVLVDGFSRLRIARDAGWSMVKVYMTEFRDMEEVRLWITLNQNARRNLTEEQQAYQMGRMYNELKQMKDVRAYLGLFGLGVLEDNRDVESVRSEVIGRHFRVNEKTVRRNAMYARGIDRIRERRSDEADRILRKELVNGVMISRGDIQKIGQLEDREYSRIKWASVVDIVNQLRGGKRDSVDRDAEMVRRFKEFIKEPEEALGKELIDWIRGLISSKVSKVNGEVGSGVEIR